MKLAPGLFLTALQVLSLATQGSAFGVPLVPYSRKGPSQARLATTKLQLTFEEDVESTVQQMLDNSALTYSFAQLREIVRDHDIVEGDPKDGEGVNFDTPALIITQGGAQPKEQNRLFRYPITAPAVQKFLGLNRNLLKQEGNGDIKFEDRSESIRSDELEEMPLEQEMRERSTAIDSELLDFDDRLTADGGLVYGILKNKTKKRFTVCFRGTVGPTDIINDAKFALKATPEPFKGTKVKMHRGFQSYLFDEREEQLEDSTTRMRTRFDRIVACLKECYEELPEKERDGYDLCVTGHSLGGALANIFAFSVAKTQQDYKYFDKVLAMTFAAPVVGGRGYNKEFQALEKEGRLRSIRISNQGDVVPSKPYPGYTQNGVNLHLHKDKEMEVDYRNTKIVFSQINPSMLDYHMLPEYENRLFTKPENQKVLKKTVAELYATAGDFTN